MARGAGARIARRRFEEKACAAAKFRPICQRIIGHLGARGGVGEKHKLLFFLQHRAFQGEL